MIDETVHKPVMINEVLDLLDIQNGGVYVDATLGGGGHSAAILERGGRVVGIDCDLDALSRSKNRLHRFGSNVLVFHANFEEIDSVMDEAGVDFADGILADLGISSDQLKDSDRGFSFDNVGPIDMRMDPTTGESLASFLGKVSERDLANIIFELGEERYSRRIASAIKRAWRDKRISNTKELADVILKSIPVAARRGRIHPATKTFQALRKYINREPETLRSFLDKAVLRLKKSGILIVISFESGEDRIVKHAFKKFAANGLGEVVTKKPLFPTREEVLDNPRSRSAKLRAFRRK